MFWESEGQRKKEILKWINFNKKSQEELKSRAYEFNKNGTKLAKENALLAIHEFKEIDADKKIFIEMTKDEWHPLPEVHEKEIIFQQFQFKDEKYAFFA